MKEIQKDSLSMFRDLVKTRIKILKEEDIRTGNMVSFTYNAKDKNEVFDRTPLSIILWRTKGYTLGLNFHWVPIKIRSILIDYILKKNIKNIKAGKDLHITYNEIKPLIYKLRLRAVVRLYINSRISKKGIVIPPHLMRKAINLPSENFIGISAEKAFGLMVMKSKQKGKK